MKKVLLPLAFAALTCGSMAAAESIEGYFRVQSALNVADNAGYVEVRGPFTVAPDCSYDDALTGAGTVMRLRAFPETVDGVERYKIANLSSQGIEVFGTPQADYNSALMDLVQYVDANDYVAAAYGLQRAARQMGYIESGRVIIQALFEVVAGRLDQEIAGLPADVKAQLGIEPGQESLADFARRFNEEVSAKMDLSAYLEPAADGSYRLYFHWIDCSEVSKFYLANEKNKKSFEIGFACMRQYMSGKNGLSSGEGIDRSEYELWKSWGYDIAEKYADCYDANEMLYRLSYEKIFADHELLYNWIKMYVERFLDPEKAPDAEVLGINFKAFATEMQRHAIMQGFLAYIPSIQEGQKLYLSKGRFTDGANRFSTVGTVSDGSEHFGLLAQEQADANLEATTWRVIPIDETSDNYFAIAPLAQKFNKPGEANAAYSAVYFDFPFEPASDNLVLNSYAPSQSMSSIDLPNMGTVDYIVVDSKIEKAERLTSVLVETKSTTISDNKVRIIYEPQEGDYNPAAKAAAPAKAEAYADAAPENALSYGVLLSTPATETALKNLWGIDADLSADRVYDLSTRDSYSAETKKAMKTPWFVEAATIPANHSFLVAKSDINLNAISLGKAADEIEHVTAIEGIEADQMQPNVIYDLGGRRVDTPAPGHIYILNGKKILVK